MKKVFFTLMLSLSLTSVNAQTNEFSSSSVDRQMGTTTKGGQKILPQAGDFAIGIDLLSLVGLGESSDKPKFFYSDGFLGDQNIATIYGKYFLTDQAAIRAKLHIGLGSSTNKKMVSKIGGNNEEQVEDKKTFSNNKFGLTVGYEVRRGYGRLQGFFGPEVGVGFGSESTTFDPGNEINANTNVVSYKDKEAGKFYAKLGGFAGVEYFFAPKMSIGGEVGIGFNMQTSGKGNSTKKRWNAAEGRVEEISEDGLYSSSNVDFKVAYSSALNVTFYF
ncbi:hypothetical protein JGH11_07525 [Dysgonomonas sp. Marseille-P4677]|uniref:hypothetical protein n=1 Tax=Dysgonomonas sp. Marseille-P4677 TaxID=2364790 RepID=UPI001913EAE6|nr:hypothetical protein [Dysgonomonas sp. Marseille-P4677]MBK5720719.1 hypothetical protein [Dysgonomonas sp. Marseille-P4677]